MSESEWLLQLCNSRLSRYAAALGEIRRLCVVASEKGQADPVFLDAVQKTIEEAINMEVEA